MEGSVALCAPSAKYVHASLAPWCLAAGIKAYAPELYPRVRIVEATINQPMTDVLEKIVATEPAVVGFSCYIWNIDATLGLCAALKKSLPRVIIILGGPEVSHCAKAVLQNNKQVDYILSGEGEESFPRFLSVVFNCKKDDYLTEILYSEVQGLCGIGQDGTIYQNQFCTPEGTAISPLTAGYAQAAKRRISYIESSRGCPYSCAFCLSGISKPRFFDLDIVLPDLLSLANNGTRTIKFIDRTFNASAAHANRILQFILEHYCNGIPKGVCFHFEIAGDILREETFALLEQMPQGVVQLEIGIQSLSDKTLKAINRKINTNVLKANIQRLISYKNMHIHIDLIAGLPYENLELFAKGFNEAYTLGAQMLQLGFLKLLYGSTMRNNPQIYPCEYNKNAPYEVRATPWLSGADIDLLHNTENALNQVYNSGRFRTTADYVLSVSGLTPFEFYTELGNATRVAHAEQGVSLDDYTAIFQRFCASLQNVDSEDLRDALVRDRLSTISTGRLPQCLYRYDARLARAVKWLENNPETAPQKGVRRGIALLYGAMAVCWVNYDPAGRNPITGRWEIHQMPLET